MIYILLGETENTTGTQMSVILKLQNLKKTLKNHKNQDFLGETDTIAADVDQVEIECINEYVIETQFFWLLKDKK